MGFLSSLFGGGKTSASHRACAMCGRTEKQIRAEWREQTARGVRVIGNTELLYCSKCDKDYCGHCQVDLGLSSGCPRCRKALSERA